jgi:hypothetical protein
VNVDYQRIRGVKPRVRLRDLRKHAPNYFTGYLVFPSKRQAYRFIVLPPRVTEHNADHIRILAAA